MTSVIGDDYKKVYPRLVEYFKSNEEESYVNVYLKDNPAEK
jgi:hypothetical protein